MNTRTRTYRHTDTHTHTHVHTHTQHKKRCRVRLPCGCALGSCEFHLQLLDILLFVIWIFFVHLEEQSHMSAATRGCTVHRYTHAARSTMQMQVTHNRKADDIANLHPHTRLSLIFKAPGGSRNRSFLRRFRGPS